jgi:hypothetical protein
MTDKEKVLAYFDSFIKFPGDTTPIDPVQYLIDSHKRQSEMLYDGIKARNSMSNLYWRFRKFPMWFKNWLFK